MKLQVKSAEGLTRPVELIEGPLQGSLTALALINADQDVSRRAPLPAIHYSKHWLLSERTGIQCRGQVKKLVGTVVCCWFRFSSIS